MVIFQIVTRSDIGGAQSVVVNLANELSKNNEVVVIAGESLGSNSFWPLLDKRIRKEAVPFLIRELSLTSDFKAFKYFRKLYKKYNPDVIHLHSSKTGILGRLAFPREKTIYTVHGFDSIRLVHSRFIPLERIFQHRCQAIVAVSEYDKQNLISHGINKNITCIYNGIETPVKSENNPFASIPSFYKRKIVCIARLEKPKRFDLFHDIASQMPDYAFIWIGNFDKPEIKTENLFCLGNIPNAGNLISYADLFMLPSDFEGLPMSIIEAMSQGIPVVASNVGGIKEIVINGKTGFTCENEVTDFKTKISLLFTDHHLYQKASTLAKQKFLQLLTVRKMTEQYMDIYKKLN